jgi:hypothetical protein
MAAAIVGVVSALLAVSTSTARVAGTALDSVTVADGCETVATTSATLTELVFVVVSMEGECAEVDSFLAGVAVVGSESGAGVAGGVLASGDSDVSPEAAASLDFGWVSTPLASSDDSAVVGFGAVVGSVSVVPVWAPPLLPMVTPGATWADEEVEPDGFVISVTVVPLPVDVDPVPVDVVPVDAVAESPDDVGLDAPLGEDDSDDAPVVSAPATP